jgi:CRP-like cAMP-binding protein
VTPDELRAVPLFDGLSGAGLERLAAKAAPIECEPGQVLALPGDPGSGMFVILDGTVRVEMRGGFYVELREGNFFGEIALLVPTSNRVARVRAMDAVRCLSVPRDDFVALVESEPSLALKMLRELARRLGDAAPD